jgi:uncharacterized membrane protein YagU involved in acid resistance
MRPKIGFAIIGGFLGTPAMSATMYVFAPLVGVRMDVVDILASMLGGWSMGLLVHVLNGSILFPFAYTFLFHRFLRGKPPLRGVCFGLMLWMGSELIVLPLAGAGLFSARSGGMIAAAVSLLGHLVYGLILGGMAGMPSEVSSLREPETKTLG